MLPDLYFSNEDRKKKKKSLHINKLRKKIFQGNKGITE